MYSDIGGLLQFALNQLITEGELMVSVRSNSCYGGRWGR